MKEGEKRRKIKRNTRHTKKLIHPHTSLSILKENQQMVVSIEIVRRKATWKIENGV